jgi:hypothetical protein
MIVTTNKWSRMAAVSVWLIYALGEFWQILSLAVLGRRALSSNAYVVTNPNVYVPTIIITLLVFYSILIRKLWSKYQQHGLIRTS